MFVIDTTFIERCNLTLEKALVHLKQSDKGGISYDLYRSACIKEFEIILEQAGKLLKKCLRPYFPASKQIDKLYFKDIFRQAAKYDIITLDEVERWLEYRDNRNITAHDYGEGFANKTLKLLPQFIIDSYSLVKAIQKENDTKK